MKPARGSVLALAALLGASCIAAACNRGGPFEANGAPSRSFSIAVGEEIIIQIGGIGPSYSSPPAITGSAIAFLEVTNPPGVATPGGALQLFHFKGVASGQAIVLFHNPAGSATILPDVIDTVVVR
jgi:hypothetical protein